MGLEISTEEVPAPTLDRVIFSANRLFGVWPALFEAKKTAVTVDVLEVGLLLAAAMLAFCFYIVLPGIRGWERLYCFTRITLSIFIGASLILCNWGQEWEIGEVHTETQYRANIPNVISATVGVKIGLRNVNITLKGDPVEQVLVTNSEGAPAVTETINYNERFWWSYSWHQGRIGFGPYAAEVNQEFRAAQFKGLPYPILWVAEYFTFDGEGIRWGRNFRAAGWYAHIMLWTAFPCWIIANILFFMNPRYGGIMIALTGIFLLIGNLLFNFIRNYNELRIPFDGVVLELHRGWCYWLNVFNGFLCLIIGIVINVLDIFAPDVVATFFGVDVLQDYEENYPDPMPEKKNLAGDGSSAELADASTANADQRVQPIFRKRGFTTKANKQRRPVAPPRRAPPQETTEAKENDEMELYENVGSQNGAGGSGGINVDSVRFEEKA